ncbi:MAG: TonB-dependent receptor [Ginsengibacter sp.]
MRHFLTVFIAFFFFQPLFALENYTISGTIRNKATGESIIGATITLKGTQESVLSNEYGFYSIRLPEGDRTLVVSYSGMKDQQILIKLTQNIQKDIYLEFQPTTLDEVVITSPVTGRSIAGTQMGVERLSATDMKYIPQLFGEKDPLKAIQLLPGIKSAGEGSSGIYVRGGAADQNLILLDEAVVYNASHLLGFFSTFNSDAVKDITVYKGGMPARYGGRLSSVIDIRMNDGNNQRLSVSGGLGLISSKLNIEGPIQKDKSSFLLSGRTTYADLFLELSKDSSINRNRLGFYDLNAKMNFMLGKKDQLFLSGYFGSDHLKAGNEFGLRWGNSTATLRWNHIYNNNIFSNTSLIYSNYNYDIDINLGANNLNIFSQIRDWNLKQELQWNRGSKHNVTLGFNSIYHSLHPGDVTSSAASNFNDIMFQKRYAWENALFWSDTWKASKTISVTYGLRGSSFSLIGKGDFYTLNESGTITDTNRVREGKFYKTYFYAEPRLAARFLLNATTSLKASYARNTQNLHLISNSTTARPTDKWVASTNNIKPEIADEFSLGYYKNLGTKYELTAETYYKAMQHQIDYRDGAEINNADAIESQLLYGIGRAYGLEFLLKKKSGKLSGWVSYTLSKTEKQIDGINDDEWYNARQDRTHEVAIVTTLNLGKKWTLSANWIFYTGDAVSFPEGKYTLDGQIYFYYTKRNGYRMPDYHRLDIGATKVFKTRGRYHSEITFSLYNAYGRENAYAISFRDNKQDPTRTEAVQIALFKYVPSISYNFKF